MKYALIGDLHGTELGNLERALNFEDIDVLVCTGDFDQIKTIRQFMVLEKKYQKAGKRVIKVPGNHDHAILNNLRISSGTLNKQRKTSSGLHDELISNPIVHKYIDKLVNSKNILGFFLDKSRFGEKFNTVVMHGAYAGDLSNYPNRPKNIRNLCFRLITDSDYKENFEIMSQADKDYNIMIRGHDHNPAYVYNDPKRGIVYHAPIIFDKSVYHLSEHRQHIINPGALFSGFFAIIDTNFDRQKVPILKYYRL